MILVDTHVIVWFTERNAELGRSARRMIETELELGETTMSAASVFELAWLDRRRRLRLPISLDAYLASIAEIGVRTIPVSVGAALFGARLILPHGDPVDRMIAGTALAEGVRLMTGDAELADDLPPEKLIDARL
jgi:PIN domain nuclease of toxin-antitoxin system